MKNCKNDRIDTSLHVDHQGDVHGRGLRARPLLKRGLGRGILIAVRRGGAIHASDSMNHFFFISRMIVPGSSYWNVGIGLGPGEVKKDDEGLATMKTLGTNMA